LADEESKSGREPESKKKKARGGDVPPWQTKRARVGESQRSKDKERAREQGRRKKRAREEEEERKRRGRREQESKRRAHTPWQSTPQL